MSLLFFFFKQKTAYEIYQCDWSSDVCSSDLTLEDRIRLQRDQTGDRQRPQLDTQRSSGDQSSELLYDGRGTDLDLRRSHRGRPAAAPYRERSYQFRLLRCQKTHHQCRLVQGFPWALAQPTQSPEKYFPLTPFAHGGLIFGTSGSENFSETSVFSLRHL